MRTSELKKGTKVWCWWKSRYLVYTGRTRRSHTDNQDHYTFKDICDAEFDIPEDKLQNLRLHK